MTASQSSVRTENGNTALGVLGAFLFSLIGGAVYFGVQQLGYIAGICGLIMFSLSSVGYNLFAKPAVKYPRAGLIVSIVMLVVMTLIAELCSMTFRVYRDVMATGMGTVTVLKVIPLLGNEDVRAALMTELLYAYLFGVMATVWHIVTRIMEKKAAKTAVADEQPVEESDGVAEVAEEAMPESGAPEGDAENEIAEEELTQEMTLE